ncbi:MAG TPA: hypothetical protein DCE42_19060, partial [Myxococcales bacterium]|nr:hypothetical protein [Myxococcales bacterium]
MRRIVFLLLSSVFLWSGLSGCVHQQTKEFQPVNIGNPRIDLQAVEQALWSTKGSNPQDFEGWMKRFEDEVNAIYFATLRQANPKADPATLMPNPVRVDVQRVNQLLRLYGYIDENNQKGYQQDKDELLFVFEQNKAYNPSSRQLYYSLRDGDGYYYREPNSLHTFGPDAPYVTGFFLFPNIWYRPYWRSDFGWWGRSYWSRGLFYRRYRTYYNRYPLYYRRYRRNYYRRYRPWGWRRGAIYRRRRGRYYYRKRYYRRYRRRYRRRL